MTDRVTAPPPVGDPLTERVKIVSRAATTFAFACLCVWLVWRLAMAMIACRP